MKRTFQKTVALPVLLIAAGFLAPISASADQRIPAKKALQRVADRHGAQHVQKIVEMKGERGQSQPEEWELIVFDPTSDYLLREFWIGDTRATNEGINYDYYPKRQPAGFIDLKRLHVDSTAAFEILNKEADRAKIGFDSVDYHLRCREFSTEPLWTLTAKDESGYQVARIDLSGESGRVLRTVWSYRQGRGVPRIKDSALLGRPAPLDLRDEQPVLRLREPQVIGPAKRKEPVVPEPIDSGEAIVSDPGTEVPDVEEIEPIDPSDVPGPDEP